VKESLPSKVGRDHDETKSEADLLEVTVVSWNLVACSSFSSSRSALHTSAGRGGTSQKIVQLTDCTLMAQNEISLTHVIELGKNDSRAVAITQMTFPTVHMRRRVLLNLLATAPAMRTAMIWKERPARKKRLARRSVLVAESPLTAAALADTHQHNRGERRRRLRSL
jgi:hypothetical protein